MIPPKLELKIPDFYFSSNSRKNTVIPPKLELKKAARRAKSAAGRGVKGGGAPLVKRIVQL